MKRLFLAIPIPKDEISHLSEFLEQYKNDVHFRDAKWVEPQNYHITALFLGDVQDSYVPEMCEFLRGLLANTPPFDLHFESLSLFPYKFPKMIWAQFHKCFEFEEMTRELHRYLMPYMAELEDEKNPIPHVTIARLKSTIDSHKFAFKPYKMPPLKVTECRLYESTLTPDGSIYTLIETFPKTDHSQGV